MGGASIMGASAAPDAPGRPGGQTLPDAGPDPVGIGPAAGTLDVTVVVPVYNPGPYLSACVDSLLAQTKDAGSWEAVLVDDGSTDSSPARLDALAADHPHLRVIHQPNSGWPGKPRNVGIDAARGRYVYFMDHDDALGDEALDRLVPFADAIGSDIVIGKMAGHGRSAPRRLFLETRERVTIHDSGIVHALSPHKLFRTAFLREHGIRFPEGRRRLEDQVFVLEAYFAASVISIFSDYTCYYHLARSDRGNAATGAADPALAVDPAWYFGFLRDVLGIVEAKTVPGPQRDRLLRRFVTRELLGHVSGWRFRTARPAQRAAVIHEVRSIIEGTIPPSVDASLGVDLRVIMALLRTGRDEELVRYARWVDDLGLTIREARAATAQDGTIEVRADVLPAKGRRPLVFGRAGDLLLMPVPARVAAVIPGGARALRSPVSGDTQVVARRRSDSTEIAFAAPRDRALEPVGPGVRLVDRVLARVDPATAAEGGALARGRWDLWLRMYMDGWRHEVPLVLASGRGRRPRAAGIRQGSLVVAPARIARGHRAPDWLVAAGATRVGRLLLRVRARLRG
jgi:hypothetical protein